jgi:hypothetical protein
VATHSNQKVIKGYIMIFKILLYDIFSEIRPEMRSEIRP